MFRLFVAVSAAALLTAGAASAAEPVQLTDSELDAVTAGAQVGAQLAAVATTGPANSTESFAAFARTDSGPLAAIAGAVSDGAGFRVGIAGGTGNLVALTTAFGADDSDVGTAEGRIEGTVSVLDGPVFASAIGMFNGSVETTGTGEAGVAAAPLIIGGTPVISDTLVVPFGNQAMIGTLAAALH